MTGKTQNGSGQQAGNTGIPSQHPFQQQPQGFQQQGGMPQQPMGGQPLPTQQGGVGQPRVQQMPAYPTAPSGQVPRGAHGTHGMQGGAQQGSPRNARPSAHGKKFALPTDGKKRNKLFLMGALLLVVIVVAGALIFTTVTNNAFFDSAAKEGQASYKTLEEIEAERNRQMQEGMLNLSIASVITFENGTSAGTAYIENVPSNKYVLKVTITTDSNGEVVYQSGGIKPDSFIETIKLSKPLAAGNYPATATFTAYDPNTLEEVGQAIARVTLVIKA